MAFKQLGGRRKPSSTTLRVEPLEDRRLLAVFSPASGEELRAAIVAANHNADDSNTIYLANHPYLLTNLAAGELVIENANGAVANKSLAIIGQGDISTVIEPDSRIPWDKRIMRIQGASTTVLLEALTIQGGNLQAAPGNNPETAQGGGMLIDGANVTLHEVSVTANVAVGAPGIDGGPGGKSQAGASAQSGFDAQGGGIFLKAGILTLSSALIFNNQAIGGDGGEGGEGGEGEDGENGSSVGENGEDGKTGAPGGPDLAGATGEKGTAGKSPEEQPTISKPGGRGGNGGNGGNASGGGVYVQSGQLNIVSSIFDSNLALGGIGGSGGGGGKGGVGGSAGDGGKGGKGGRGGVGGQLVNLPTFPSVRGGDGGDAGKGGRGDDGAQASGGGIGGSGGRGGNGQGGGVYLKAGKVTSTDSLFDGNVAEGGEGGDGASGGVTQESGHAGNGGEGAKAGAGGLGPGGFGGNGGQGGVGGDGGNGAHGVAGGGGGRGGAGGDGLGGTFYLADGSQTSLTGGYVKGSEANGGAGAHGGNGANGGDGGDGGDGGKGGDGGDGNGVNPRFFQGRGGNGAAGGKGGNGGDAGPGGAGGFGGDGGSAQGGAIYRELSANASNVGVPVSGEVKVGLTGQGGISGMPGLAGTEGTGGKGGLKGAANLSTAEFDGQPGAQGKPGKPGKSVGSSNDPDTNGPTGNPGLSQGSGDLKKPATDLKVTPDPNKPSDSSSGDPILKYEPGKPLKGHVELTDSAGQPTEDGDGSAEVTLLKGGVVINVWRVPIRKGAGAVILRAPKEAGQYQLEARSGSLKLQGGVSIDVTNDDDLQAEFFKKVADIVKAILELFQDLFKEDIKDQHEFELKAQKWGPLNLLNKSLQALEYFEVVKKLWEAYDAYQKNDPDKFTDKVTDAGQDMLKLGAQFGATAIATPTGPVGQIAANYAAGELTEVFYKNFLAPGVKDLAGEFYDNAKAGKLNPFPTLNPGGVGYFAPGSATVPFNVIAPSRLSAASTSATTGMGMIVVYPQTGSASADNLTAAGTRLFVPTGSVFNGVVAQFTDATGNTDTTRYHAYVAWGNGAFAPATVTSLSGGNFSISGSTSYAATGIYTATIVVVSDDGSTAFAYSPVVVTPPVPTSLAPSGPTAAVIAPNVDSLNAAGTSPYVFSVVYSAAALVNVSTLADSVVQIQPPSGPAITAEVIQTSTQGTSDTAGNAPSVVVTYRIVPPGGDWRAALPGAYRVLLSGSPVSDLAGSTVAAGEIGQFNVNVPATFFVDSAKNVGVQNVAVSNSADLVFYGTAPAKSTVEFYQGTTLLGTTKPQADGLWSFNYTAPGDGQFNFTAVVRYADNTTAPPVAASLKIDTLPPQSNVASLPQLSDATFPVNWNSSDSASGLVYYDVYVSDNGGGFAPLVTNTLATSANFTGQTGHTYQFYSIAHDSAGNQELQPTQPDALTKIRSVWQNNVTVVRTTSLPGSLG